MNVMHYLANLTKMIVVSAACGSCLETAQSEPHWPSDAATLFQAEAWTESELGEGGFFFANPTAPTRIGSIDGPLAGPGIWGQMFAGLTADTLAAVGIPMEHTVFGYVLDGVITVPGSEPFGTAYAQMYAWDGQLWGTDFNAVPIEWTGRTDIVPVSLAVGGGIGPAFRPPIFTQPAIVPIPEPSPMSMLALGTALGLLVGGFGRGKRRVPAAP